MWAPEHPEGMREITMRPETLAIASLSTRAVRRSQHLRMAFRYERLLTYGTWSNFALTCSSDPTSGSKERRNLEPVR